MGDESPESAFIAHPQTEGNRHTEQNR